MRARGIAVTAAFLMAAVLCVSAGAEISAHPLFSDNAVLQQKTPIPVWGKGAPGEQVSVRLGKRKAVTAADEKGDWMVWLKGMKSGGPHKLTVAGPDNEFTARNVMIGEVWVCSGQSNMAFRVRTANNAEAEIAAADYPDIRLCQVPRAIAHTPQSSADLSWNVCTPETIPNFSAVGYFFGRQLHQELGVPIGLIDSSWGGTPCEAWTSLPTLEALPEAKPTLAYWEQAIAKYPEALKGYEERVEAWKKKAAEAKAAGKPVPRKPYPPHGPDHSNRPAVLYNGLIAPLIPYAIQGAIWYQGEGNATRAYQYRALFPAMIKDWRQKWGQGDFPFYWVQLANFRQRQDEPGDSAWAELREAQNMTLALPNTGTAVIIDIGDADDIHPKNKQDVGKRLALNALAGPYHSKWRFWRKRPAFSSPMMASSKKTKDGKMVIHFDHADGGLVAMGTCELKGFAVAGADRKFYWAQAAIQGKDKVVVWSDRVADPVAVRYAWADNPECNLYDRAGLPASPFRTDDWPGITSGKP